MVASVGAAEVDSAGLAEVAAVVGGTSVSGAGVTVVGGADVVVVIVVVGSGGDSVVAVVVVGCGVAVVGNGIAVVAGAGVAAVGCGIPPAVVVGALDVVGIGAAVVVVNGAAVVVAGGAGVVGGGGGVGRPSGKDCVTVIGAVGVLPRFGKLTGSLGGKRGIGTPGEDALPMTGGVGWMAMGVQVCEQ